MTNKRALKEAPWYDTQKGVRSSLGSLDSFNKLLDERRKAGYKRNERLNDFYVLGDKYFLDACGNAWKKSGENQYAIESDIPTAKLRCKRCGEGWNMGNIEDTVVWEDTQVTPLTGFVGKTLGNFKKHLKGLTDGIYSMQSETLIRNDAYIDLSPRYPGSEDKWEKGLVKNERGWVGEREGITNEHVIQKGDEAFVYQWTYYHHKCNRAENKEISKKRFLEVFEKAGFKGAKLRAIKNQYCGCDHCAPWWVAKTDAGQITIGWRKRVININYDKTLAGDRNLFLKEQVTHDVGMVHAYGWDKAIEYLTRIHQASLEKPVLQNVS